MNGGGNANFRRGEKDMEYEVIKAHNVEEFNKLVNERLADDWQLEGNLCTSGGSQGDTVLFLYAQAMTKKSGGGGVSVLGMGSARRREA